MVQSLKLAGYLRISTVLQQDEDGCLEVQKEVIRRYSEAHGHRLVATTWESRSALQPRPVFDQLLQAVLDPKWGIGGIIVAKLDRIGRSIKDLAEIAEKLHRCGKHLISVQECIDTSLPGGERVFRLISALAVYERGLLIERTKEGRALAEKRGVTCHRPRKAIDDALLKQLKEEGLSQERMAQRLRVSRSTVRRRLQELKMS
jgi:DNA invertase Pin-like site-specific DNA recombinase